MNLTEFVTAFQQRLGFVNILILLTSPESFTSHELLSHRLYDAAKEKQEKWLTQARSNTGHITPGTSGDIIDWAVSWGLLFPSTFSWTTTARILDHLISDEEYNLVIGEDSDYNPLNLSMKEKLFYLYICLKEDGASLVYLLNNLISPDTWSRQTAANLLPDIYEKYGELLKSSVESLSEISSAQTLIEFAEQMRKGRKNVVGTKELRVTPRLEQLVDLGIIDKPPKNRDKYVYVRTEFTKRFAEQFDNWLEPEEKLDSCFFKRCAYTYGIKATEAEERDIILTLLRNYEKLVAAYGIAGIDEVALLSSIEYLCSPKPIIMETDQFRNTLINFQKDHQKEIKLHVNSKGHIRYYFVEKDLLKKLISN